MTTPPFDVITIGRVGIDLYPTHDGVHLDDADLFSPAEVDVLARERASTGTFIASAHVSDEGVADAS